MGEGEEGEKEKDEEGVDFGEKCRSSVEFGEATDIRKEGVTGVPLAILLFLELSK